MTDYMALQMWTVFDHPLDFPDGFIARRMNVGANGEELTDDVRTGDTLEAVRDQLPPGLFCMARSPEDDAVIVETWF